MVKPSNPRLMARVLNAVVNLSNTKGSSAHEVLSFIRQSNLSHKNLTVQVQRALRHAVNAGLLRHRSGRYKVLATLNPASVPPTPSVDNTEPAGSNQKTEGKKSKSDLRTPTRRAKSPRRKQERKKSSRRRSSRHRSSKARRKSRRSPYARRPNATVSTRKRRQRKRAHDDEEYEDLLSGSYALHDRDVRSPVSFNRRTKRTRVSKREPESDFTDESDRESDASRERVSRANKSTCRVPRRKETPAKSRGRSASRTRSPQRAMQARQHTVEEAENDRQRRNDDDDDDGDDDHVGSAERDVATCQETQEDDGAREPNNSNSGSTLENSRD